MLRRLAHPEAGDDTHGALSVVVAPVRAVLQPISKGLGDLQPVALQAGDDVPLEQVVEALAAAAYARTDLVERRGEFAVRGGILDVFPPTEEHPLRLEFWGDTVEEIRWFKVADQRSLEVAEHGLWAPPCRELLLTDAVRERAAALADQLPGAADLLEKLAQGIAVEGMESLAPALVDGMETLLDLLPDGAVLVACDPERVRTRAHDLTATSQEFLDAGWANAASGNAVPIDLASVLGTASFRTLAELRQQARDLGVRWLDLTPFARRRRGRHPRPRPRGRPHLPRRHRRGGRRAAPPRGRRLAGAGRHRGPGPGQAHHRGARRARRPEPPGRRPRPTRCAGLITVTTGAVGPGFLAPGARLAVITETDLTGSAGGSGTSTKDMRRMPSRRRNQVDPLQLRPGDFVVHEQHGVGRFVEMMQRTVAGATREYLVLEYAPGKRGHPGDRLYVPTDQLDQVTRYVGGEQPTLNKMGGSDWQQTKSRAKRYVKQIAAELIRLYSARMATAGHAFPPGHPVAARARGRLRARRDARPAEHHRRGQGRHGALGADGPPGLRRRRLRQDRDRGARGVQGDPGRQAGGHPVPHHAARAAARQHLRRAVRRVPGRRASALSRFQTDREAKAVLDGLADGTVDLVIGTHRILGKEVRFKDLGLVVIDEEQRFGVEHKEQLKALRTSVDVLAMSATPIPRTLEMAVTGIREMSTLQTPPEERHPVLTYVGAYDEKTLTAAIRRELMREGQVFFVHNKVSTIEKAAARIRELVPEARIAVAHGKMGEHKPRAGRARLLGEAVRRARLHHDRRDRASTSPTPTPSSSSGPTGSGSRSCTSCAGGSGAAASAPTPTSSTRPRRRSPRRRSTGCRPSPATPTSARACRWR